MLRLRREGQWRGGRGEHMFSFVAMCCLGPEKRAGPGYSLSQVTIETGSAGDHAPKTSPLATSVRRVPIDALPSSVERTITTLP